MIIYLFLSSYYRGVIHQLCRVLVLLHKKDPGASIPSDALGLMEWAHQMIDDRQLDNSQVDIATCYIMHVSVCKGWLHLQGRHFYQNVITSLVKLVLCQKDSLLLEQTPFPKGQEVLKIFSLAKKTTKKHIYSP